MVNINKLLKQAQKMQEKIQQEMEELEVEGSAGGGAVKVRMNGKKTLLAVEISKDAVDPEDMTVLEDLVLAAVNDAIQKVEDTLSSTLGGSMPPGMPLG